MAELFMSNPHPRVSPKGCPYDFFTRKADMIAFLCDIGGHSEQHCYYPLSWNVKVGAFDETGKVWGHESAEEVDPKLDSEWGIYFGEAQWLYEVMFEDARSMYVEGEWTSWPGDDQGDWTFEFAGRSGGYLILHSWNGHNLEGILSDDFEAEFLEDLPWKQLRKFYRGIQCLHDDLNKRWEGHSAAEVNVSYHLNFQRVLWEEEKQAEEKLAREEEARMRAARVQLGSGAGRRRKIKQG